MCALFEGMHIWGSSAPGAEKTCQYTASSRGHPVEMPSQATNRKGYNALLQKSNWINTLQDPLSVITG